MDLLENLKKREVSLEEFILSVADSQAAADNENDLIGRLATIILENILDSDLDLAHLPPTVVALAELINVPAVAEGGLAELRTELEAVTHWSAGDAAAEADRKFVGLRRIYADDARILRLALDRGAGLREGVIFGDIDEAAGADSAVKARLIKLQAAALVRVDEAIVSIERRLNKAPILEAGEDFKRARIAELTKQIEKKVESIAQEEKDLVLAYNLVKALIKLLGLDQPVLAEVE